MRIIKANTPGDELIDAKTLSVPQMITNEDVAKDIIEHIGGSVSKEVEKRALKWL